MDVEHREKKEDPLEILRKSLALGKISNKEYKESKLWLDKTSVFERSGPYSEEYYILRMRLAYGEIKLTDFWDRMTALTKEENNAKKAREKEEKQKRKQEEKNEKKMAKESKTISQTSEEKPKKHFWNR